MVYMDDLDRGDDILVVSFFWYSKKTCPVLSPNGHFRFFALRKMWTF